MNECPHLDDIEISLLIRLERAVVETVQAQIDDAEISAPLIAELVVSMEREARRGSF